MSILASTISAPTQPLLLSIDNDEELVNNQTSTFFNKFKTRGPSLTLTLRDPSTVTLLSGSSSSSSITSKLWPSKRDVVASKKAPAVQDNDDGTFGIYSKLATIFHITPTSNNGQPQSTPSQFTDGYMLDDGEIFLDPPTSTSSNGKSSRGLFSIREMGNSILGNGWGRSLENVHPEIQYEMKTREQQSTTLNGNEEVIDTRPFPDSAPWITGISCGMIWSPFPIYKTRYPEGYGHKLLSVPHYVRCGAKLSLPRFSSLVRQAWRQSVGVIRGNNANIGEQQSFKATTRELNLGVTYQENPYRTETGTLEFLLGRSRSSIPPSAKLSTMKKSLLSDDDKYRRNNHLLVRLATGRSDKTNNKATIRNTVSSIEYIKGSFRMPTPSFMRNKGATRVLRGKGVSVSPSFDFVEGIPRCTVSGDVGKSGRTRAVLRVDVDDSTLTVVRALDENKIIAPTISLNSGKIVYDYYFNLDDTSNYQATNGKVDSSLRAHVDPTKGIILKWTDGIKGGQGSCWITECRVPLGTSAPSPLAADVRVGRRWVI